MCVLSSSPSPSGDEYDDDDDDDPSSPASPDGRTCYVLKRRFVDDGVARVEDACYVLRDDEHGMGCAVYTIEQRESLLARLVSIRERLVDFIEGRGGDVSGKDVVVDPTSSTTTTTSRDDDDGMSATSSSPSPPPSSSSSSSNDGTERGGRSVDRAKTAFDPSLYVREDGTVDWDGALQDREALKKFGGAVWSRINGQDPEGANDDRGGVAGANGGGGGAVDVPSSHAGPTTKAVTARIEETDAIREKRESLDALRTELRRMEVEHIRLLNSAAISAGQAVANVNLATIDASLRQRIRESSDGLDAKKAQVTFQTLNYELERIYTYLEGELGNTSAKGYIPLQDRLNVAEFGLLESQVDSFNRQIESGEVLDADVLAVVADQLVDFKRRLGIDYYVTGLTFDMEAVQVWIKDIWVKTKNGFTFYVKGTRLFVDDVLFCTSLILRASQGYTLKPREVRTLRRTFKDTITFIPVVIILLIPLSPIGHVLVFGAIQRVFPDFFPSCFTERRQNLLELYESTEYSAVTINENWQEKLIRLSQAIKILVVRLFTELYTSLGGVTVKKKDDNKDNQGQSQ
ncbi:hypothetical protein ACHAW5_008390 [Stephanodiscus triporus]|uniref:Letm1 RBD domain-containing protein n=1 Tax=Stephanodiscus triporus TaxID=2934178 RepID=A0ABD3N3T8_9STRA